MLDLFDALCAFQKTIRRRAINTTFSRAAAQIVSQRLSLNPITPLTTNVSPQTIAEGYSVQAEVNYQLMAAGMGELVGHKIGCTTPVMQAFININHPCAGRIFSRTVMHGHGTVPSRGFIKPGVECEITVRLAQDLPPQATPYTKETVARAVGEVMASIELVDERYQNLQSLGVPTLIADDFFNAGCVLGTPTRNWRSLDLASLQGRMWINDVEVASGSGAMVLGHPLNALAWLANAQSQQAMDGLKAGEFVMLGSLVQTQWIKAGDRTRIEISGLGSVSLDMEA